MKGRIGLLALLVWFPVQAAGERFASDFEGTLLKTDTPVGVWDFLAVWPGSIQSLTQAAATRGMRGLRIDDQDNTLGRGDSTSVYATISAPMMLSQAQLRFRFRVTSTSQAGSVVIAQALSDAANQRSLCDISLAFPGALVTLSGSSRSGDDTSIDSGVRLDGGNVLIECTLRGLRTDAGTRTLHLDSVQIAKEQVDFSGLSLKEIAVGEPFSEDRQFVGQLDFDDVRVADRMQASRLVLDAGSAAVASSACVPVGVGLTDSEGTFAGLPYAADFNSALTNAALFSDAVCSVPIAKISFALDQTTGVVFLRPGAAPQLTFGVAFPDLVGAAVTLPIQLPDAGSGDAGSADAGSGDAGSGDAGSADAGSADAGSADAGTTDGGTADGGSGPLSFAVGCNCEGGPGVPLVLLAFLTLLFFEPHRRRL